MLKILAIGLATLRLCLAAALLGAAAWVLSWRLLWKQPAGSDTLFHLQLASWVSASWPGIDWWFRWDASGLSYREGYPLAAHWLVAALSRAARLETAGALQLVQFLVNPLCALGVYLFCAWRLQRPLAGLAAGLLYLLNPISWTFLVDWGFFANQVGTVLFMPCLIALDACFAGWVAGRRDWSWRLAAVAFAGLTALMGMVAPSIVWAPLLALPAYAAAAGERRAALRWLFLATPALVVAALALSAFWALPLQDYLNVVASRAPRPTYSRSLFHLWSPEQVLQLRPPRLGGPDSVYDRASLSPAAWLPALAGVVLAVFQPRLRPLVLLSVFGLLSMTWEPLYAATFDVPLLPFAVHFRVGMLFLQFGVPVLAAAGLFALPPWLLSRLGRRMDPLPTLPARGREKDAASQRHGLRRRGWRLAGAWATALVSLALMAADVTLLAQPVAGARHSVAYGTFGFFDQADLWQRHKDDPCANSLAGYPICRSEALASSFSLTELIDACRRPSGGVRQEVAICASLSDLQAPRSAAADSRLVEQARSWCAGQGAGDPVCSALLPDLLDQLADPRAWRPPTLSCASGCAPPHVELPPVGGRAMVDANNARLLQAFQLSTGRPQAYGYNSQLLPSPELDDLLKQGLLEGTRGLDKADLARRAGVDTVVLGPSQGAARSEYASLGWRRAAGEPQVYTAPQPAAAAQEWPRGMTVLVVGATAASGAEPYNQLVGWAGGGGLPSTGAWLARGGSPYLDDYSDQDLARYQGLWLLGYRYHDAGAAWQRVENYARSGGAVYVETGWQYVDPDWNVSTAPQALPVRGLGWTQLDPSAPALVDGVPAGWAPFDYQGAGWGASSAQGTRSGAQSVVSVGGHIVAARWQVGRGRLFWSGANLLAHAAHATSVETDYLASQWRWLLGAAARGLGQLTLTPDWRGNDEVVLPLRPASSPAWVLFKESSLPGWSATLETPSGSQALRISSGELDYMLLRLDRVPAGSRLVLRFGPTWRVHLWWALSATAALLAGAWLLRLRLFTAPAGAVGARITRGRTSEDG
ncbi:MAG: hypothetical protein M3Z97_04825 [Candidatus Dormibacteraeota bacterium]|nr:hypothetical protein [Candidatus Dormibacteraeota bacterium]